jgi:hypothetical protein
MARFNLQATYPAEGNFAVFTSKFGGFAAEKLDLCDNYCLIGFGGTGSYVGNKQWLVVRYQRLAFSQQSSQDNSRKVEWKKPRKRGEYGFWHGVGIVNYVSKSLFFERGVSKLFVLPRNRGFFEGSFGCGGWVEQWSVASG